MAEGEKILENHKTINPQKPIATYIENEMNNGGKNYGQNISL
ncbi:MAG: hypothetical protein RR472_03035 [Anaerovoracaceae bacterium]